ncbi:hypothetical protein ROHU_016249 [Labeo rohita]|uniref:Uncharacterized protein n=1 Tax=Labeo rohita TaxID=84645 RepID=A0A498NKM7_LABRO|nr:hypothetical protein ROHU_016249 [Labeo rohita]
MRGRQGIGDTGMLLTGKRKKSHLHYSANVEVIFNREMDREVGFIKENTENLNCYAVLTWRLLLTGKHLKEIFSFNHNTEQTGRCCDDDTSQEPLLAKLVQP